VISTGAARSDIAHQRAGLLDVVNRLILPANQEIAVGQIARASTPSVRIMNLNRLADCEARSGEAVCRAVCGSCGARAEVSNVV